MWISGCCLLGRGVLTVPILVAFGCGSMLTVFTVVSWLTTNQRRPFKCYRFTSVAASIECSDSLGFGTFPIECCTVRVALCLLWPCCRVWPPTKVFDCMFELD